MATDYTLIYNQMEWNKQYTATELKVAGITMTAMAKRGMVKKIAGTPARYIKQKDNTANILKFAREVAAEYFVLFSRGKELGMMCSEKSGAIVDCYGKPFDTSEVFLVQAKGKVRDI